MDRPASSVPGFRRVVRPLRQAALGISTADLFLFRRLGLVSWAGRSDYNHAAMAVWKGPRLYCVHTRLWGGGQRDLLEDLVRRYPGRIDVFQANAGDRWCEFSRGMAARKMESFVGKRYGIWAFVQTGLSHVPLLWHLVRPTYEVERQKALPHCSMAVNVATEAGGVDPVRFLDSAFTEPGDLARSLFYQYLVTLVL